MEQINNSRVTKSGLMWKTLLGVLIAFFIAIPNLMQGDLFLNFLYQMSGFSYLFMSILVTIGLGIIWAMLYKTLAKDNGAFFNFITFVITSAFAGLFLGNALIFAVLIIQTFGNVNVQTVISALQITTGATFIAVFGGIIALPRLKMDGTAIKFFKNITVILIALTFASGIMWVVGYLFHIFGFDFILNLYYKLIYGLGPISLTFSIFAIIAAEFMFLITLSRSLYAVDHEPKHMEYFYSIILVNSIIRIYVEIFKFVLKILASKNRE